MGIVRELIQLGNALHIDDHGHLTAAFTNLHDEIRSAGEHPRLVAVLREQRDGLLYASCCGIIECLQESPSFSQSAPAPEGRDEMHFAVLIHPFHEP